MGIEELIESVKQTERTKSSWRNNYSSTEWKQASKLNKLVFGIPLNQSSGCQCIEDLFFYIHRKSSKSIQMQKERRFKLKKGLVVQVHQCTPVTSESPEEKLIDLLRKSPGHIVSFESYPENWKEIVNGEKVEEVTEQVEETQSEEVAEEETEIEEVSLFDEIDEKFKSAELKSLIIEKGLELPKDKKKSNLINFVIENELY